MRGNDAPQLLHAKAIFSLVNGPIDVEMYSSDPRSFATPVIPSSMGIMKRRILAALLCLPTQPKKRQRTRTDEIYYGSSIDV